MSDSDIQAMDDFMSQPFPTDYEIGVDVAATINEPAPNALDKFMARINLPELSEDQRKVKGFIIYALSYDEQDSSTLLNEISSVFSLANSQSATDPPINLYGFASYSRFRLLVNKWPTNVKCCMQINNEDYLVTAGGSWEKNSGRLYTNYVTSHDQGEISSTQQLLIISALAEAYEIADSELYLAINEKLQAPRPQAFSLSNNRLRNVRLAIGPSGLQIAGFHGDGYYSPTGEPVNVEEMGWTRVEIS